MKNDKLVGKIFGIALVLVMIGSMLASLPGSVNAGIAQGPNSLNEKPDSNTANSEGEKHARNTTEDKVELTGRVEPKELYSHIDLPDFGPDVLEEVKQESTTAETYGGIPTFRDVEGRWRWLNKLDGLQDMIRETIRDEMPSCLYPEGSVIAYGYDVKGFFFVVFLERSDFDETLMDEIYGTIDNDAKEINIEDVPVVFKVGSLPKLESERDDVHRPIIGGVQVQNVDQIYLMTSTLGFSAVETDWSDYGYVVAGHLGHDSHTPIGTAMYQPTYPSYPAGIVSDTGGDYVWETVETNPPTNAHAWDAVNEWLEIKTGDSIFSHSGPTPVSGRLSSSGKRLSRRAWKISS